LIDVKRHIFLLVLLFIFIPKIALGYMVISEIMYDPKGTDLNAGGEWIEVKNEGTATIDLTKWFFFENDTNHRITAEGGSEIPPGGYAVISKDTTVFRSYFVGFSGSLFKSSFSLNDGEKLAMKSKKESLVDDNNSVVYSSEFGAKNDGNSLQLISGKWQAKIPTPGSSNGGNQEAQTTQGTTEPNPSSQIPVAVPASDFPIEPQIYAFLSGHKMGVAGGILQFEGMALGLKREPLLNARFLWNFGDGSFKEGKNIAHTYHYPGEYIVFLNVSSGKYSASAKINVKITESNLKITDVNFSASRESLVEIYNDSISEMDVSHWSLRSGNLLFTFPKNSFIGAGSKLTLSSLVTNLNIDEGKKVELLYPNGSVFYSYDAGNKMSKDKTPKNNLIKVYEGNILTAGESDSSDSNLRRVVQADDNSEKSQAKNNNLSLDEDLDKKQTASVVSFQDIQGEDRENNKWILFVIGFSLISVLGVVVVRRRIDTVS